MGQMVLYFFYFVNIKVPYVEKKVPFGFRDAASMSPQSL